MTARLIKLEFDCPTEIFEMHIPGGVLLLEIPIARLIAEEILKQIEEHKDCPRKRYIQDHIN